MVGDNKQNCIVIQKHSYFTFNLNSIMNLHQFPWKLERLVWIAYEKNENNENCLLATVAKDVILHIISFLV